MAPVRRFSPDASPQLPRHDPGVTGYLVPKSEAGAHRARGEPLSTSKLGRLIYNSWFAEALAISFSAACLIALVLVLRAYDGGASPQLHYGLTLNAIVSILATASKASLVCAVAGALSQLKWCWFTTDRRLDEMQAFDDASRGPWGSTTMLFSTNVKPLATVGAMITILALTFDPFVQQVIHYPTRSLQRSVPGVVTSSASDFAADPGFQYWSAINAGLWSSREQFSLSPACPSGNCIWPSYQSMGWCSKCANYTSSASLGDCDTQLAGIQGPGGSVNCTLSFDNKSTVSVLSGSLTTTSRTTEVVWPIGQWTEDEIDPLGTLPRNRTYLGIENPLLVLGHASLDWYQAGPQPTSGNVTRAEQCVLTPCVRSYNVSITNGTLSAEVTDIDYGVIRYPMLYGQSFDGYTRSDVKVPCWQPSPGIGGYNNRCRWARGVNATNYTSQNVAHPYQCDETYPGPTGGRAANMSLDGICPAASYIAPLRDRLTGSVSTTYTVEQYVGFNGETPGIVNKTVSDALQVIQNSSLSYISDNVAASLTKLGLDMSNDTVTGQVTSFEVYVLVRWQWLALPIALEIIALLFLLGTALLSSKRKVRLWKSSVLPFLYHGLDPDTLTERYIAPDVHGMRRTAKDTTVKLTKTAEQERIVLKGCLSKELDNGG